MKKKKLFLYVISAVLVSGLTFSFFVFLKIRTIRGLRAATESVTSEISVASEKSDDSDRKISKQIPDRMWAAEFIETSYALARRLGIRDLVFEQKGKDTSSAGRPVSIAGSRIRSYPVKLTFHSGYREMAEFIHELQSSDRLVTIDSVSIKAEKSSLAVEVTAVTYSMEAK